MEQLQSIYGSNIDEKRKPKSNKPTPLILLGYTKFRLSREIAILRRIIIIQEKEIYLLNNRE